MWAFAAAGARCGDCTPAVVRRLHLSARRYGGAPIRLPKRALRAASRSAHRWQCSSSTPSSGEKYEASDMDGYTQQLLPVVFVGTMVLNRLLYRMLLVPMREYTFLISQVISVAYVLVYGTILSFRRRGGIISTEKLRYAQSQWRTFVALGTMEALAYLIQVYCAARLPGALLGVFGQSVLPFTMLLSVLFLNKRYNLRQVTGVSVMIAGVLCAVLPTSASMPHAGEELWVNSLMYLASSIFAAASLVIKEGFLQGANLDVFLINTFGSSAQLAATVVLSPLSITLALGSRDKGKILAYVGDAFRTLRGQGAYKVTPLLGAGYLVVNLIMNVAALTLVKRISAVTLILSSLITVPLISLMFCLKLPLLTPSPFSPLFFLGVLVVIAGSALYNYDTLMAAKARSD